MDKRLVSILTDVFSLRETEIHPDLTKDDVDVWDSLKQMDLVVSLENGYGISLEMSDIVEMTSVKSIMLVLNEKGVKLES